MQYYCTFLHCSTWNILRTTILQYNNLHHLTRHDYDHNLSCSYIILAIPLLSLQHLLNEPFSLMKHSPLHYLLIPWTRLFSRQDSPLIFASRKNIFHLCKSVLLFDFTYPNDGSVRYRSTNPPQFDLLLIPWIRLFSRQDSLLIFASRRNIFHLCKSVLLFDFTYPNDGSVRYRSTNPPRIDLLLEEESKWKLHFPISIARNISAEPRCLPEIHREFGRLGKLF